MITLFLVLLNFAFAGESLMIAPEPDVFVAEEYRCQFVSHNNNRVTHQFKIYTWETDKRCSYGIKVNDKVILVSTAKTDECQEFMQIQVQKGSVCLSNF